MNKDDAIQGLYKRKTPKPKFNKGDLVELETGERLYVCTPMLTPSLEVVYQLGISRPGYKPLFRAASFDGHYSEAALKLIKKASQ